MVPHRVLAPIAVDAARGWILLPDGGPPLADRVAGADLVDALAAVLRRYGKLQRDFAPEIEAALTLGVADMRPQVMPSRLDEALETVGRSLAGQDAGGDRDLLREIASLRETYRLWCERLATAPGGASLDHNDLHHWNMLVLNLDRPDEVRFTTGETP
jgi:hypothetical protein